MKAIRLEKCTYISIPKNGTSSILDAIGRSIGMKEGKDYGTCNSVST